ncbi:hypothetical protein C8Q76DRAFT_716318 [Earliella scabrosa]|nr:hypothetical protein C8Q76DRAFT_716318 [Earliella scabrosa]
MHVHNWKTGELVWRHTTCVEDSPTRALRTCHAQYRLMDSAHILQTIGTDVFFCTIPAHTQVQAVCQFQLPPLAHERLALPGYCAISIRRPPTYSGTNGAPHFQSDPTLTVLALTYHIRDTRRETPVFVPVIVFIPLATIAEVLRRRIGAPAVHHAEPPSVPWDEWIACGPGARLVILPPGSVLKGVDSRGSRVAIRSFPSLSDYRAGAAETVVFDLHPLAAANDGEGGALPAAAAQEWISDCYPEDEASVFRGAVRSTLPYRIARPEGASQLHGDPSVSVFASHDGLLFVDRKE